MCQGKGQGSPGGVTGATGSCLDGWFGLTARGGLAGLLASHSLWGPEPSLLWRPSRYAAFPGPPKCSRGCGDTNALLP